MATTVSKNFFTGGITLHSAFDFKFDNSHLSLSDEKLAQFRFYLSELKLIIIDEISLIPSDMLYQVHLRLCEIFQNKAPFANKGVITVGDLLQVIYKTDITKFKYTYNVPNLISYSLDQTTKRTLCFSRARK